jgi:hypothetical protein
LVCLEQNNNGKPKTTLECGHVFHTACIQTWFDTNMVLTDEHGNAFDLDGVYHGECPHCRDRGDAQEEKDDAEDEDYLPPRTTRNRRPAPDSAESLSQSLSSSSDSSVGRVHPARVDPRRIPSPMPPLQIPSIEPPAVPTPAETLPAEPERPRCPHKWNIKKRNSNQQMEYFCQKENIVPGYTHCYDHYIKHDPKYLEEQRIKAQRASLMNLYADDWKKKALMAFELDHMNKHGVQLSPDLMSYFRN